MEGATAIGRLLGRYGHLALDDTQGLEYHNATLFHGVRSLPMWLGREPATPTA
jgi:hypothetical protein